MNNLISNYNQILDFAQKQGIPISKERGIIREYLQTKFLFHLYNQNSSNKLSFIGGTSLRLLRNLPRFSEDLDFDNLGLADSEIATLIRNVVAQFQKENIETELYINQGDKNNINVKFPNLLSDLKITTNPREKLMIKFDYTSLWKNQQTEVVLLNKFGFIERIVTNTLNIVFTQKLTAFANRKQTQPRDMFDVVWLFSQGAKLDKEFMRNNDLDKLVPNALYKFDQEKKSLKAHETRLKPFLFNEDESKKITFLGDILNELQE